jgi:hypothetical protein
MTKNIIENLPVVGGMTGAIVDVTKHSIVNNIEDILVYIGYVIIGALVGYAVKALLNIFEVDKKISKLKERLKKWDKDISKHLKK